MRNLIYELWLYDVFGNDVSTILTLFQKFKTPENMFQNYDGAKTNLDLIKYEKIAESLVKEKIQVTTLLEETYPEKLKNIEYPPYLLFYKGNLPLKEDRMVSLVGPRKATDYGRWAAYQLAQSLAESGIIIVSGLAYGADTCAHKACVDHGKRTIAVLGTGVDLCSPASNRRLSLDIIDKGGALISEFFPKTPGYAGNYPRRNRIISGISESLIVVEAGERSGTLITARHALDQGKEIYALPGNITSSYSKGTNKLIKDGAIPILDIRLLKEEMGIFEKNNFSIALFSKDEKEIYQYLAVNGMATKDRLQLATGKTAEEINFIVTVLELKDAVKNINGKIVIAK